MKIAILGGTGEQGPGLALRWALAGQEVIIGSRQQEKGERVATELNQELGKDLLRGTDNVAAAAEADVVFITVPYSAHVKTVESVKDQLKGKKNHHERDETTQQSLNCTLQHKRHAYEGSTRPDERQNVQFHAVELGVLASNEEQPI